MDEYTYKGYTFRRTNYYAKQLRNGCLRSLMETLSRLNIWIVPALRFVLFGRSTA